MIPDEIVDELRESFRNGATVAGLLKQTRTALGEDTPRHEYLRAFWEIFRLNPGGWTIIEATESFGNGEQPDQVLSMLFLVELIRKASKWDEPSDGEPRWHDGLRSSSWKELGEKADAEHGISEAGWAAMSEQDRWQIRNTKFNTIRSAEIANALAALAEQLQRRVTELERQPAEAMAN